MIDIGKMIQQLRTERQWTQNQLARKLNITKQTVSNYENNRRSPDFETLELLADVFNVPMSFFVTPEEEKKALSELNGAPYVPGIETIPYTPARAMVPVIGSVRCGPGGLAFEELQGAELADVANPNEYFYLRADGDSMEPDIRSGDLVLVHRQPEVESGALAVVIINGEEGTLKRISYKPGAVILTAINPAYPPRILIGEEINDIIIAGRVMQTVRKY